MRLSRIRLLMVLVPMVCGCAASPANPGNRWVANYTPSGDVFELRGVVNGVYRYDPEHTIEALSKYESYLSPGERESLSTRYIVRVGFKKDWLLALLPVSVTIAKFSDYVMLPEGWTSDAFSVSKDAHVINVGDVVDVKVQAGRYYDFVESVVRQCDEEPVEDEKPEWNIGCRTYREFDSNNYAGEKYYLRAF